MPECSSLISNEYNPFARKWLSYWPEFFEIPEEEQEQVLLANSWKAVTYMLIDIHGPGQLGQIAQDVQAKYLSCYRAAARNEVLVLDPERMT